MIAVMGASSGAVFGGATYGARLSYPSWCDLLLAMNQKKVDQ